MKIQIATLLASVLGIESAIVKVTIGGKSTEWTSFGRCFSDAVFESTRAVIAAGTISSAASCISTCVSSRNVAGKEECRFVQWDAGKKCVQYLFKPDVASDAVKGCGTTQSIPSATRPSTVYIPRLKMIIYVSQETVAGGSSYLEARTASLRSSELKAAFMKQTSSASGEYTFSHRVWWATEGNNPDYRVTKFLTRSATETEHRQRSGPQMAKSTQVVWAMDSKFVADGKEKVYNSFVAPLLELYNERTSVHSNHRVDGIVRGALDRCCGPRGGSSCRSCGHTRQITSTVSETYKVPDSLTAVVYDMSTSGGPTLLATLSVSNSEIPVVSANLPRPKTPLCSASSIVGMSSGLATSARFTLLSSFGIALGPIAGAAFMVYGLGSIALSVGCFLQSPLPFRRLDTEGGDFPEPANMTVGSAAANTLMSMKDGLDIEANRKAYCDFKRSSAEADKDEEWCNRVVYEKNSWFHELSESDILSRMDGECEAIDGYSIDELLSKSTPELTGNLSQARSICTSAIRAIDQAIAVEEQEVAQERRVQLIAGGVCAFVVLSALSAYAVRRRKSTASASASRSFVGSKPGALAASSQPFY